MAELYHREPGIEIYLGKAEDVVPLLDFDGLVLADPPYGISHPTDYRRRGRESRGIVQRGPRSVVISAETRNYAPVAGDDKPFDPRWLLGVGKARVLWGGNWFADKLPPTGGWLVWDKERPDDLDQATCELAWTDCVKGVRRFRYLWNGAMKADRGGRDEACGLHPTQKPTALMKWCLSLRWTRDFKSVLDPYMGSGPVIRAAKELGVRAIGIECAEEYCRVAVESLAQRSIFDLAATA
jgi:hypothetical protein